MTELFNWIAKNRDIIFILYIGFKIIEIVVIVELIKAVFAISKNVDKMHNQNAELYKLLDITNELISVEIREQRAMHGYDVDTRLDGEHPDE